MPATMPEISKCAGVGCNRKETCYRFTSEEPAFLVWLPEPRVSEDGMKCAYHWPVPADPPPQE